MRMKKLFFAIPFMLCALTVSADGRSEDILAKLAAKIASLGEYNASFEVEAEGNRLRGQYAVSGDRYYMKTALYEVVCDGNTKWEINHEDEEVVIDNVNPADRDILSNPTRAFDFAGDIFRSAYRGAEGEADVVELTPVDTRSPLLRVTLRIDRRTGLPTELRYLSVGLSEDVVIRIAKLEPGLFQGAAFTFDKSKYKDYDIIDFRSPRRSPQTRPERRVFCGLFFGGFGDFV